MGRAAYVVVDVNTNTDSLAAVKAGLPVFTEQWLVDSAAASAVKTEDKYYASSLSTKLPPVSANATAAAPATAPAAAPAARGRKRAASPPPAAAAAAAPAAAVAPAAVVAAPAAKRGRGKAAADAGAAAAAAATAAVAAPATKPLTKAALAKAAKAAAAAAAAPAAAAPAAAAPAATAAPAASTHVSVIVKGLVPVDQYFPMASSYSVHHDSEGPWDAMLNQTNIGQNNNKFYVLQLLESDNKTGWCTWFRWGRVGVPGQNMLQQHSTLASAKAVFQTKYTDKTVNRWRAPVFSPRTGKYTLIHRDYGTAAAVAAADAADAAAAGAGKAKKSLVCDLDPRVQSAVSLISDMTTMKKQMLSVGYDADRMPLGKLSKTTLREGLAVLSEIADLFPTTATGSTGASANASRASAASAAKSASAVRAELTRLSSRFYTLIPHVFGMKQPPVIDSPQMLRDKIAMVESLSELDATVELVKQGDKAEQEHPVTAMYKKLRCDMSPVARDGEDWKLVHEYITNTHASTHSYYKLELTDVLELAREGETARFDAAKYNKDHNRQLLWHGSRLTNFVGILSQGLRIAPPEAPVSGYMFGKGVYFADMVSKSANYCNARPGDEACLLLCEVALGNHNELYRSDYNANRLPPGKLSTKGIGRTFPGSTVTRPDGLKVPLGKPTTGTVVDQQTVLLYNEFIVYDVNQIKMKYLVRVKFRNP